MQTAQFTFVRVLLSIRGIQRGCTCLQKPTPKENSVAKGPEQKRKLGINALKQSQYDYTEFKKQFINSKQR